MLSNRAITAVSGTFAVAGLGLGLAGFGIAAAAPPGFPDLNAFQPVDPARYTAAAFGPGAAYFVTPDGVQCVLPNPYKPSDHVSASCDGPLPGLPDNAPVGDDGCSTVSTSSSLPDDLGPYGFHKGTGCPILTSPLLSVGQEITTGGITCVVGADRLTACIDPILNRGFVIQPSGSWTF
jgi:hypothetical protein